ncbi:hypothetical protein D3C86_1938080 [compost metagenome]
MHFRSRERRKHLGTTIHALDELQLVGYERRHLDVADATHEVVSFIAVPVQPTVRPICPNLRRERGQRDRPNLAFQVMLVDEVADSA